MTAKNISIKLSLLFCLFSTVSLAETLYINDNNPLVWSRTGPSAQHKVKHKFPPGAKFQVLSKDDASGFVQVKDERGRISWIQTEYLSTNIPARELLENARQKNVELEQSYQKKIATLEKKLKELTPLEEVNRELQEKHSKLNLDFEVLQEKKQLYEGGFRQDFFFSGAAVVLGGMFLGWLLAKSGGKKNRDGWK